MNRNDLESRKLDLENQVKALQEQISEIDNQIESEPVEFIRFEISKVSNKWILYTPVNIEIKRNSLKELISEFMNFRNFFYATGKSIEVYDRDKKILYKEFHRIYKLFTEILPKRESDYRRQKTYRLKGIARHKPPKKHEPKTLRPILREERTW